ncbi:MAG: hypothetical protein IJ867_01005 [Clostridia bacterium]|nr:hypothetical protein [Clostridia bacterium]
MNENKKEDENPLTEEEIRELNLFTEERRQASIAKYGRDIYAENKTIGNKKVQKVNGLFDKIFDFIYKSFHPILFIILILILLFIWVPLIKEYS